VRLGFRLNPRFPLIIPFKSVGPITKKRIFYAYSWWDLYRWATGGPSNNRQWRPGQLVRLGFRLNPRFLYKCSRSGRQRSHAHSGDFPAFAQDGSKRLKKAQKGAKGLKKALENAVRACPVPPVRSKRLFEPASVPPVRSKRLFETAVRDLYSKVLGSATLCSEPLYSALLCSVHVYARVHTSIYIYI